MTCRDVVNCVVLSTVSKQWEKDRRRSNLVLTKGILIIKVAEDVRSVVNETEDVEHSGRLLRSV
jgi:hypothetical protein